MYQHKVESVGRSFWSKLVLVCVMMFFVFLGDAIYSDWTPTFIQQSLGGSLAMGLVMSFSSLAGLVSDLVFPQLLRKMNSRKIILFAVLTSLFFGIIMRLSIWAPIIILFLSGMVVWGVYYEFLGFGAAGYISSHTPSHFRTSAWSVMNSFRGLAYFLGPLIGSLVALNYGNKATVSMAMFFTFIGLIFLILIRSRKNTSEVVEEKEDRLDVFLEMKHWGVLLKSVWPIAVISLVLGILDATFWTTGTVFNDNLAMIHVYGGLFLPLYELPMVVVGLLVAKLGIYKGKKKLTELFMMGSGILLMILSMTDRVELILVISLLVGIMTAVCWPLKDAIYTDVVNRMGFRGKHMIGLSGSTVSVAYILGPIISGAIAQTFGEKKTFVIIGVFVSVMALLLLVFTPKKMRLPESEIESWN